MAVAFLFIIPPQNIAASLKYLTARLNYLLPAKLFVRPAENRSSQYWLGLPGFKASRLYTFFKLPPPAHFYCIAWLKPFYQNQAGNKAADMCYISNTAGFAATKVACAVGQLQ